MLRQYLAGELLRGELPQPTDVLLDGCAEFHEEAAYLFGVLGLAGFLGEVSDSVFWTIGQRKWPTKRT